MLAIVKSVLEILKESERRKRQILAKKPKFTSSILVVDDEQEAVELVKNHLAMRIVDNVNCAYNGEDALLKVKKDRPDMVILDIRMPGMDGLVVLKEIKEIDDSIVVIITSVVEDQEVIKEAMKLGADDYLIKPFDLANLDTVITANILLKKTKKSK